MQPWGVMKCMSYSRDQIKSMWQPVEFVVQSLNHVWLFATPWTVAHQASLSFPLSWSFHKVMSIELVMPSNHLILCHSLLLPPSIFPSIRVFSSESVLRIRWPKDRSFSFSISPSKEYSRLISFRIDWFDRLVPQGTLKSVLQHHISKASVFWHSDFSSTNLENIQGWDFDLRKKKKILLAHRGFGSRLAVAKFSASWNMFINDLHLLISVV